MIEDLGGAGDGGDFDDGVSGVGCVAVALEGAAVGHEGALVAHVHHRAEDLVGDAGLGVIAEHADDPLHQGEGAVHHARDAALVYGLVDDVLPLLGQLGLGVVLAGLLVVLLVGVFLGAGLALVDIGVSTRAFCYCFHFSYLLTLLNPTVTLFLHGKFHLIFFFISIPVWSYRNYKTFKFFNDYIIVIIFVIFSE